MLHIINQSPFTSDSLQRCLRTIRTNDHLLLIEDGVIAALKNSAFFTKNILNYYALETDIIARGLQNKINTDVKLINYDQFVELTIQHHPILSWA